MEHKQDSGISVFNKDAQIHKGYFYTTNCRLSSYLANRRLTDMALAVVDFCGRRVLDIGCGDGSYTLELFDRGQPLSMRGVDLAQEAVRIAQEKAAGREITFEVQSIDALTYAANSFDIAHIRGVLHHMDNPINALKEALRVSSTLVIIEPNGYNPILKLIELFSRYHIKHGEKSYLPVTIDKWVNQAGGKVYSRRYAGLVPFFCPDWLAKLLKGLEPFIERMPLINRFGCAVYVIVAVRREK